VYFGVAMIVVTVLAQQRTDGIGVTKLCKNFGVSRLTVIRWLAYFREFYPQSAVWQALRGRFMPPVTEDVIPRAIIERLMAGRGDPCGQLIRCTRLLSGVSGAC
jgi:hypothetical protein